MFIVADLVSLIITFPGQSLYDIEVKRRFKLTVSEIISRATCLCIGLLKERDDTVENHVSTCTRLLYCKIKQNIK